MQESDFSTAYREARRLAFRQSVARLQQAAGAAVSTLLKVMVDPASPASTRVRAADSVLGHAAKAIEIEDIEVRTGAGRRSIEVRETIGPAMSALRTVRRLERLQERLCPESDDTRTLEELCRSLWRKDKKRFWKLASEYRAIRHFVPPSERPIESAKQQRR